MSQSEKSWDHMSMDERLEETGFDDTGFEIVDLDQHPLYEEPEDAFDDFEDRPSGVYLRGAYIDDMPDPVYDYAAIDAEEKVHQAWLEAEAERIENLDPMLNQHIWSIGKFVRGAKSNHKVIAPLRKRLQIDRKTKTGHRAGKKDRPFTPARKNRERDRLDLLKAV
ncbi:MAG: hypothetical protein U0487_01920 [Patescibacteria group bacterium]